VWDARDRSRALVKGETGRVLGCLAIAYSVNALFFVPAAFIHVGFGTLVFLIFVWSTLTAPFEAHVLTVIYYRLSEPQRPVIHPNVERWESVWEGH
jgi:hypothetical protein